MSGVGYAFLATAPVWPVLQPREPILDEMLVPAEVAVLVPVVMVFPVAWGLIGRTERTGRLFGLALTLLVLVWSSWTAAFGDYATPPNIDDGLRWYLLTAACVVVAGVVRDRRKVDRRWILGAATWVVGMAVTVAVPVVEAGPMPSADALLPLPPGMTVVTDEAECTPSCSRRFVVTGQTRARDLARQLGEHLQQVKGWQTQWYEFTPEPHLTCREASLLVNPYKLCGGVRVLDEWDVEVRFGYANNHNPIY
ncbi:hypothetical protein JOF56_002132 [Kibdelosporangium banguiense]|uniref:Uncharacterized protein n=1 Tax=Kibdelosporangium banguiense TaxID=1365924 RepID=A0ABS4TBH1_9PSEU|nr:hypothetical protein [Kibdelosporangium banguiense]MBP2321747.1 hypothetical protein [Kibdelosporangium banguiense]